MNIFFVFKNVSQKCYVFLKASPEEGRRVCANVKFCLWGPIHPRNGLAPKFCSHHIILAGKSPYHLGWKVTISFRLESLRVMNFCEKHIFGGAQIYRQVLDLTALLLDSRNEPLTHLSDLSWTDFGQNWLRAQSERKWRPRLNLWSNFRLFFSHTEFPWLQKVSL